MRRTAATSLAGLALAAAALSGCGGAGDGADGGSSPTPTPSSASASGSPTGASSAAASASTTTASGSTTKATPTTALLDWAPLPGDGTDVVRSTGPWQLIVSQDGSWWSLGKGNAKTEQTPAPQGMEVADAELNDDWAVVVYGDEDGTKQQRAVVTALASGKTSTIDRSSDLPPSTEGSWALDGDTLWHATDHGGSYCLASTDLSSGTSALSWCAPPHQGFNNVIAADGQVSMLSFDDKQPSCRTVVSVSGTQITPFPDVPACHGAEGALLGSGSGASRVWSMVPHENRYQQVHVYASTSGGTTDLGPGDNSTLLVCGASAYWARDASGSTPAAIMRWDGSTESVVYRAKGFLGQPLCSGHTLSILDSTDGENEQLSATVS